MLTAALVLAASDVSIQVEVLKPLKLQKGELKGVISVTIKNGGAAAVQLSHRDVHGFFFTPEQGGTPSVILHPCDCAFELGHEEPPKSRTFSLAPGEQRVLRFDDFACNGGPHRAPAKGRYMLTWQVTPVASEATPRSAHGFRDLKECERLMLSRRGIESPAIPVRVQ